MTQIRETAKYYVWTFSRWQFFDGNPRNCNTWTEGPAAVYVSKSQFHRVARGYGHGDAKPNDAGDHGQTVGAQIFTALRPERVRAI